MSDGEFGFVLALAQDYGQAVLGRPQPGARGGRTARLLRDVAASVQREAERRLRPALDRLELATPEGARRVFREVTRKEFEDGVVNWGRIVTVFALEGILLQELLRQPPGPPDADAFQELSYLVAEFLTENAGEWIRQHGGWEHGFVQKFEPKSGWLTFLEVTGKVMLSLLKQHY